MTAELVSVIVPIYKVEKYLDRCVDSLVRQTYPNLEIILVDDGSPDRCPEICDQWARKDGRICVIHKPNGGVSSARNAGLETSSGEWVFFVDSDDFLPENALECLMQRHQKNHADLICGSFHIMKSRNRSDSKTYKEAVLLRQDFANQLPFLMNELYPTSCGKLFKTQIIKEQKLSFPQGIPLGEDATFHYRYLSHTSSVITTEQCVYHYDRTREDSATKKYYEDQISLETHLFAVEKEFLQSVEGNHTDVIKELEKTHFAACVQNYALYETNREKQARKVQEAAILFPEAANHEVYGEAVRQQDWLKAARLWQRQNFKWYVKEVLKRYGLFRS